MHDTANSDAAIAGCLKDCGFSQKDSALYLKAQAEGDIQSKIRILLRNRNLMMDKLHIAQKRVDCIDFMIRKCKEENNLRGRNT